MRLKMAENSLFAVLLRSSWWISVAIAAGIATASRALLPDDLWPFGAAGALPFLVISALAARRQWRRPDPRRIESVAQACRAMSRGEFTDLVERALTRDGHAVRRLPGGGADLLVEKSGRHTLIACARWKAASSGTEPLKSLQAEIARNDAHDAVFIALGEVSEAARTLAAREGIRIMDAGALAVMVKGLLPR